jgi:hypothetical protein
MIRSRRCLRPVYKLKMFQVHKALHPFSRHLCIGPVAQLAGSIFGKTTHLLSHLNSFVYSGTDATHINSDALMSEAQAASLPRRRGNPTQIPVAISVRHSAITRAIIRPRLTPRAGQQKRLHSLVIYIPELNGTKLMTLVAHFSQFGENGLVW